jgi:exonuclease SbcC
MIPHKLTIQGIYSYQQRQTIDFTTLTQAGLFGIFGSVGSGKSTILEAISFALFGQSERLNARDNRNYNMMNLKSNELYIDFEFASGHDTYRFTVQGRRNTKKFEEVKKLDHMAYHLNNGEWTPISEESAPEITGLNYDNFHRTIIIPQGKFQEFLQLTAKDRTNMLRELFNLNKFELYRRVANLDRDNDFRLQNLQGQLENIGAIDPEEIGNLEKKQKATSTQLEKTTKQNNSLLEKIKTQEATRNLQNKLNENRENLNKLLEEKEKISALEKKLKEYETYNRLFRSALETSERLTKNRESTEKELKQAQEKHTKQKADYQKLNESFEKTRQTWQNRDKWLRETEELEKLTEIRKLNKEISKEKERQEKGSRMHLDNKEKLTKLKDSQANLKELLNEKKRALPDIKILADIRDWFSTFKQLNKEKAENTKYLNELKQQLNELNKQISAFPTDRNLKIPKTEKISPENIKSTITGEKEKLEKGKSNIEHVWHQLQVQQQLQKYAHELEEGKPCPLCGSEHHPVVLHTDDISSQLKSTQKEGENVDKRIRKLTEAETQLFRITDRLEALTKEQKKYNDSLELLETQIKQHREKFNWDGYSPVNENLLKEAFQKYETISKEVTTLEKQLEKTTTDIEYTETEKEKYQKILDDIERGILDKKSRANILSEQFNEVEPEKLAALSTDELANKASGLKKRYAQIDEQYKKEEIKLTDTAQKLDTLSGQIQSLEKQFKTTSSELQKTNEHIQNLLKEHNITDREYVNRVVFKEFDVDASRRHIEHYHQQVNTLNASIKQHQSELDGRTFDEKQYEETKKENQQLTKTIDDLNRSWGETNNTLTRLKKDQKKAEELKKEHDKTQERSDNLKMMKNLFKGGAFVNYISTVYLQELVRSANERFYRLTRQHLSLELTPDNSFQVRDFLNEGHVRSVKTLSGGQTFQASLSLALALADSIQKHTSTSGNFFFLDEGFGTLDRESLSIVFDTLKSLRHENRIVGVISHVEEMQQEIETYLQITNDEEIGSLVKSSWE